MTKTVMNIAAYLWLLLFIIACPAASAAKLKPVDVAKIE